MFFHHDFNFERMLKVDNKQIQTEKREFYNDSFKSLCIRWKHMISNIPAAIRKFPQTNVLGNKIITEAMTVTAPLIISPVLSNPHFPNIAIISGFPEIIAVLFEAHKDGGKDRDGINNFYNHFKCFYWVRIEL
jgi:hypothetical protein